jgi:uncharacterized protein YbaA (DUF1428 family)
MFAVVYLFRVARRQADEFLRVQRAAAAIYREHGALDDVTWRPVDLGRALRGEFERVA